MRAFLRRIFPFFFSCCPAYAAHRLDGPKTSPPGPGYTTIVTLTGVPPGDYVVVAKTVIVTTTSDGSDVHLAYDFGAGRADPDRTNQSGYTTGGSCRMTHNLEALIHVTSGTAKIWLEGRSGQTWSATDSKIIAVQVSTGADAEVTS